MRMENEKQTKNKNDEETGIYFCETVCFLQMLEHNDCLISNACVNNTKIILLGS